MSSSSPLNSKLLFFQMFVFCKVAPIVFSSCLALCAVSGPALETFVGDDVNTLLILNLLSDTEYSVQVIASYTTGSSQSLTGKGKTCESTSAQTHT